MDEDHTHVAGFFFFLLLLFLFLLFLVLFSDGRNIENHNYQAVPTQKSVFVEQMVSRRTNFAHILMSFGEIIRLTAANFLVFFALP